MTYAEVEIEEVCVTGSGGTPSRTKQDLYFGGRIPWVKSGELRESIITQTEESLTDAGLNESAAKLLPKDALLVALYGATVGRVGILGIEAATNQAVCHIIPDSSRLDRRYLFHALRSKVPYWLSQRVGGGQPNISQGVIKKTKIPLPPLSEQKRIAEILDRAEALRAKRRAALALLDELTQSIFLDMFGDPVTNPKGWPMSVVGEATQCIVPGRDKPKSFSGNIPWVTTEDLVHLGTVRRSKKNLGLSASEIESVRARIIPESSVLMSCAGQLGILSISEQPMVVNQQLHTYQCRKSLNPWFLMYCLSFQQKFMQSKASSTTLSYMNKTVCNSIPITVPPIELQDDFEKKVVQVRIVKATESIATEQHDQLLASLQHRAFRGEL